MYDICVCVYLYIIYMYVCVCVSVYYIYVKKITTAGARVQARLPHILKRHDTDITYLRIVNA